MEPLAKQRCVQIKRIYDHHSVRVEESSFDMYLYKDEVVVGEERFPLQDIFDVSYYPYNKPIDTVGFLYLHTIRGVKTYYVKERPIAFVQAFKRRTAGPSSS